MLFLFRKTKGKRRRVIKKYKKKPPAPTTTTSESEPTVGKQEETRIQFIYLDATDFNKRAVDLGIVEEGYDAYTEYKVNYQKASKEYSGRIPSEVLAILQKYRPVINEIELENLDKFGLDIVKKIIAAKNTELEYLLSEQVGIRKELEDGAKVKETDDKLIGELESKVLGFEEKEEESKYQINKLEEKVLNYKKEEDHLRNKVSGLEKEKSKISKERDEAKKEASKYKSRLEELEEEEEELEEEELEEDEEELEEEEEEL